MLVFSISNPYICKYYQYIISNCNTFNIWTERINRIKVLLVEFTPSRIHSWQFTNELFNIFWIN